MSDRRLTPANARVAHVSLGPAMAGQRMLVQGERALVTVPVADLLAGPAGPRDRQLLMGARVLVLERHSGHAFVRADRDGYCGYVAMTALGADGEPTHWVSAPATHLYSGPGIKTPETALLSLGARLQVTGTEGALSRTVDGRYVPTTHLRALGDWARDPAGVAESLIGTPYLWGGNSRSGIDCSGLVQAAHHACGIDCPGDSDMQEDSLGQPVESEGPYRRGDLFFWRGHVAMAVDSDRLIHANGFRMAVTYEGIADCVARILRQESLPLRRVRRL